MNKAWLYSSLLGIATLGVVGAHYIHDQSRYHFMSGAESLGAAQVMTKNKIPTRVEVYTIHEPYSEAWSHAEDELCNHGWKLTGRSATTQTFDWQGKCSISLAPGKADRNLDFIDGTEATDTYVVIRTKLG